MLSALTFEQKNGLTICGAWDTRKCKLQMLCTFVKKLLPVHLQVSRE